MKRMIDKKFETKEEGIEKLKHGVSLRNQMGGSLYWNVVNDDCIRIAGKLLCMGVDRSELQAILNN